MRIWVVCGLLVSSTLALADTDDELLGDNTNRTFYNIAFGVAVDEGTPRLAFVADGTTRVDRPFLQGQGAYTPEGTPKAIVVAWSADKTAAWAVADLQIAMGCNLESRTGCGRVDELGWDHATVVIDHAKASRMVAWSVENTVTDAAQAKALKAHVLPPTFARKIDAGAEDAVKLFESTIADPKAFAATVSDRKDSVLFGSGKPERYTGGAAIKTQLAKWNLKLAVRDGVQAGVAGTSVAWVGANVDATSLKNPKAPAMPYRVFVVYEKTAAGWQLVSANFGVVTKLEPFER